MEHKLNAPGCVHVLDDFLFVGPCPCLTTLKKFIHMSEDIGIPIKVDKTVYPTTTLTFLGLEIDTFTMELRLPEDKLIKLRERLIYLKKKKEKSNT